MYKIRKLGSIEKKEYCLERLVYFIYSNYSCLLIFLKGKCFKFLSVFFQLRSFYVGKVYFFQEYGCLKIDYVFIMWFYIQSCYKLNLVFFLKDMSWEKMEDFGVDFSKRRNMS